MKKFWTILKKIVFGFFILIYAIPMFISATMSVLILYLFYYPTGLILTSIEAINDGKNRYLFVRRLKVFSQRMHITAVKIYMSFFG